MNNIYVDELPKDCWNCQFLDKEYFNNCYCGICQKEFDDEDLYVSEESFEHKKAECCPLKSLKDALAEERKKVVQMIKAEFEPSPDSTVITGTPTPEAELVNRGFSVCKKRVYKVLDRIERGE